MFFKSHKERETVWDDDADVDIKLAIKKRREKSINYVCIMFTRTESSERSLLRSNRNIPIAHLKKLFLSNSLSV